MLENYRPIDESFSVGRYPVFFSWECWGPAPRHHVTGRFVHRDQLHLIPSIFASDSTIGCYLNKDRSRILRRTTKQAPGPWRGTGDDWILRASAIGEKLRLFFALYFQFRSVGFPPQGLGVKDTNESIGKSSHATSGTDAVQRRGSGGEVEGGNDDGLVNGWSIFGA